MVNLLNGCSPATKKASVLDKSDQMLSPTTKLKSTSTQQPVKSKPSLGGGRSHLEQPRQSRP